jgi:hypothetical protein
VFCRGTDDQLWGKTWRTNAGWGSWLPVGGRIVSDPDAGSQGTGFAPHIVARGTDYAVWEYAWDGHACTCNRGAPQVADNRMAPDA